MISGQQVAPGHHSLIFHNGADHVGLNLGILPAALGCADKVLPENNKENNLVQPQNVHGQDIAQEHSGDGQNKDNNTGEYQNPLLNRIKEMEQAAVTQISGESVQLFHMRFLLFFHQADSTPERRISLMVHILGSLIYFAQAFRSA